MIEKNSDEEQLSLKSTDLEELNSSFRAIVDIRDRKYGFPSKTCTFSGFRIALQFGHFISLTFIGPVTVTVLFAWLTAETVKSPSCWVEEAACASHASRIQSFIPDHTPPAHAAFLIVITPAAIALTSPRPCWP